jgi:hypothetical protein
MNLQILKHCQCQQKIFQKSLKKRINFFCSFPDARDFHALRVKFPHSGATQ